MEFTPEKFNKQDSFNQQKQKIPGRGNVGLSLSDATLFLTYLTQMRYMVYETRDEIIPLAAELDYLEKHLEPHQNRLKKVFLRDIIFIEGMRDYRQIYTAGKLIMTLQIFTEFEKQIPPKIICCVHKSQIVALAQI